MTRLEKLLSAALVVIVVGGGGYAAGRVMTSSSSPAVTGMGGGAGVRPSPSPSGAGTRSSPSASGFRDDALATSIARQAGARLAGDSPVYVPAAQAQAESDATPPGATVSRKAGTITFSSATVSFTAVAVPPGGPDMTFRVAGLANPTLVVPKGSTVEVRFINADTDQAHGWEVTSAQPPFQFHIGSTAFAGAFARPLGDPTGAGDGAETIAFTAGVAGRYNYVCPMPGHAQMGMYGTVIVR